MPPADNLPKIAATHFRVSTEEQAEYSHDAKLYVKKNLFFCFLCILLLLSSCGYSKAELEDAKKTAYDQGYLDGYEQGQDEGYDSGYSSGSHDGYGEGYFDGIEYGTEEGYSDAYDDGYNDGYSDGYDDGYRDGYTPTVSSGGGVSTGTSVSLPAISNTVYITATGTKYHRSGCQYLSQSSYRISLAEAKSRGYTPCSRCW